MRRKPYEVAAVALLLASAARLARGQDMGDMGDMGDDGGGADDMSDVLDPTLMGMGDGSSSFLGVQGMHGQGGISSLANLKVQTLLALQELGVVMGVAFMVAGIFFLMVFMEKFAASVLSKYNKHFGKPNEDDVEDPAALVGTFKRYKN